MLNANIAALGCVYCAYNYAIYVDSATYTKKKCKKDNVVMLVISKTFCYKMTKADVVLK